MGKAVCLGVVAEHDRGHAGPDQGHRVVQLVGERQHAPQRGHADLVVALEHRGHTGELLEQQLRAERLLGPSQRQRLAGNVGEPRVLPGQAERLTGPHHRAQRQLAVLREVTGGGEQSLPGVRDGAGAQLDLAEQQLRLGVDVLGHRGRLDPAQQHPGAVRFAALPCLAGRGDEVGRGHHRVGGELGRALECARCRRPR